MFAFKKNFQEGFMMMMNTATRLISMYNLDGSLLPQRNLLNAFPHHFIDCCDIRRKNLYCDPEALHHIHERYLSSQKTLITLIGCGNYHYVSYIHLLDIHQPFTLILFDHHTDLMENEYFLTCGSWVTRALRDLPNMKKAIIIGPNPDDYSKIPLDLQERVTLFPDYWDSQKLINQIYNECDTEDIYISIDKDVLDESYSKTNWDHGYMDLNVLIECVTTLFETGNIHHVDICGEWPVPPENTFNPKNQAYIKRNEKANIALIRALVNRTANKEFGNFIEPQNPVDQAYQPGW
jgi:arginase family enzyme